MKKSIKKIVVIAVLGVSVMAISCAENDKAHESMNDEHSTMDEMHEEDDHNSTLGEDLREGTEEMGDDIEDASEDVKEEFEGDGTVEQPEPDEKEVENIKPNAQ